jgi:hypothetical protein
MGKMRKKKKKGKNRLITKNEGGNKIEDED